MEITDKLNVKKTEIAQKLGWEYPTVVSIMQRKKPADKYQLIKACERKILKAKEEAHKAYLKTLNL